MTLGMKTANQLQKSLLGREPDRIMLEFHFLGPAVVVLAGGKMCVKKSLSAFQDRPLRLPDTFRAELQPDMHEIPLSAYRVRKSDRRDTVSRYGFRT